MARHFGKDLGATGFGATIGELSLPTMSDVRLLIGGKRADAPVDPSYGESLGEKLTRALSVLTGQPVPSAA